MHFRSVNSFCFVLYNTLLLKNITLYNYLWYIHLVNGKKKSFLLEKSMYVRKSENLTLDTRKLFSFCHVC
jgi:hypothetical protein